LLIIGLIVFVFAIYWLPTIVAYRSGRRNTVSIGVLNFFLGWTFIGWVIAFIWAFKEDEAMLPPAHKKIATTATPELEARRQSVTPVTFSRSSPRVELADTMTAKLIALAVFLVAAWLIFSIPEKQKQDTSSALEKNELMSGKDVVSRSEKNNVTEKKESAAAALYDFRLLMISNWQSALSNEGLDYKITFGVAHPHEISWRSSQFHNGQFRREWAAEMLTGEALDKMCLMGFERMTVMESRWGNQDTFRIPCDKK
jgi:hypothetical protein